MYTSVMDQEDEFDVDEMERVQPVNQIYDCFVQAVLLVNDSKRALVLLAREDISVPEETLDELEM